ncbi:MAG: VWA domain-containing protein [Chloroflexi bacterium]|nr:VWA domain-containing protein [Chloroflexota bacterium]
MRQITPLHWALGTLIVAILLVVCGGTALLWSVINSLTSSGAVTPSTPTSTFELAYSPEKAALMKEVIARFNGAGFKLPGGQTMTIDATAMDAEEMVDAARGGRFTAISPDSSLWLAQLDAGRDSPLVGEVARYAVTPVVIAMWNDTAQSLGYPKKAIGWQDLLSKARFDPNFRWSHPAASTASGVLATLAEFYAGAGKTRALTEDDVRSRAALDYVAALEKTVRYYGEGEQATIDQLLANGRGYLDATVVSERMVIYHNSKAATKLVAVYPAEGALWQDHPLALLEQAGLGDDQRLIYRRLRDFLLTPEIQKLVLQSGYRPVDLNLRLDDPASPIRAANGVDPTQPQTTLQMPSTAVVTLVQASWALTKRPTNIYLVVDTSGSMETNKLAEAQKALNTFLDQIQGDRDRVGLVPFATRVYGAVALKEIGPQRASLKTTVNGLRASGQTALLDAIAYAYDDLQKRGERDRINAIVVMTDGMENGSATTLTQLTQKVQRGNQSGVPVVIFCIAYGGDADLKVLTTLAEATGGQARRADPDTIRKLYKILSTYF